MAAAVAKPPQVMRRSRPSLNTNPTTTTLATTTTTAAASASATKASTRSDDATSTPKRLSEPYVRDANYILRKFAGRPPSLIVHLHPTHFRFEQQDGSFSYDSPMKAFLVHLRRQTVPHEFLEELLDSQVPFYDGCLIVQVHDHKSTLSAAQQEGNLVSNSASTTDHLIPFSMHNYHDHITPSPFGVYPRKHNSHHSPKQSLKTEPSAQNADKKKPDPDSPTKKHQRQGPRIMTIVLHPTPRTRQQEMLILANTPAPDARAARKATSKDGQTPTTAQPPHTPLSAPPLTPLTNNPRLPPNKRPKMLLEEKDYYTFEAELLLTTEPPLLLHPARNPEEAVKALNLLSHPLHSDPGPAPKTRKRTHAEMAADDAQAAEEERRMLIMDERVKPSMRPGAGMTTGEGQTTSSALGFSRFKTLETIKQRHEENDRRKKEEEARQAMEKRNHEALLNKRKEMENRQRAEQMAHQNQQKAMKLQAQQQHQQQQLHVQNMAQHQPQMATNPQQQQLQQAALAQHSSPIVRQQTPMMASSPLMQNAANMSGMGGFPMQATASSQGAGSPPRPPSAAMQHANVGMARQMSNQQGPSRHPTPQMAQNTPRMAPSGIADPHRLSATPQMQHRSPMNMQGTPQPMMNNTPQMNQINAMNQQHLTPGQQMALMSAGRQRMQGAQHANMTPEQVAMMRQQQQIALQQQQAAMNPQAYAAQLQRMQQQMNNPMAAAANASPMQQQQQQPQMNPQNQQQQQQMQQQQQQQLNPADPQAMLVLQRQQQLRAAQLANNQRQIQAMIAAGQPVPQQRLNQIQMQQRQLQAQQQQMAMRVNQTLGDPNNTDQYLQNLRAQQLLLQQMQRRNQQQGGVGGQQGGGGGGMMQGMMGQQGVVGQQGQAMQAGQGMQQMNMLQQQQQQQQQMLNNARAQGNGDLAQQFAAMQNALNRSGTGGMG